MIVQYVKDNREQIANVASEVGMLIHSVLGVVIWLVRVTLFILIIGSLVTFFLMDEKAIEVMRAMSLVEAKVAVANLLKASFIAAIILWAGKCMFFGSFSYSSRGSFHAVGRAGSLASLTPRPIDESQPTVVVKDPRPEE